MAEYLPVQKLRAHKESARNAKAPACVTNADTLIQRGPSQGTHRSGKYGVQKAHGTLEVEGACSVGQGDQRCFGSWRGEGGPDLHIDAPLKVNHPTQMKAVPRTMKNGD